MEFNAPLPEMGLAPVHTIVNNLNRMFGKGVWENFELETISLELGIVFDELTKDKLNLLQLACAHPDIFYTDVLFFLHTVNVVNNNIADFETFPLPSSLEIAYAHIEMKKVLGDKPYSDGIQKTIKYILDVEGYSEPVWPFSEMGIKSEQLAKGQEPEDTKKKQEAVKRYIEGLESDDHRNHS